MNNRPAARAAADGQRRALQVQHGPIPLRYFETEIDNIAARCDIDIIRR
jgi:hypothetical protein